MFSKVSSYKVKRALEKEWNEQEEFGKYITSLNIDWLKGWLMIDDTVIEKPFAKKYRKFALESLKYAKMAPVEYRNHLLSK